MYCDYLTSVSQVITNKQKIFAAIIFYFQGIQLLYVDSFFLMLKAYLLPIKTNKRKSVLVFKFISYYSDAEHTCDIH